MTRFTVRRTSEAIDDLDGIWSFIAKDDLAAADRTIDQIEAKLFLLSEHPKVGRVRNELTGSPRGYAVGSYLLIYGLDERRRCLELLRVLDGRRDLARLFS